MSKFITVLLFAAFILVMIIIGPILAIWSWNTLFGALYGIPYTVETWLAVIFLGAFFRAKVTTEKKQFGKIDSCY